MRIECENCHAAYSVPDEKVAGRPFRITCKRCKHVIHVRPDGQASGEGEELLTLAAEPGVGAPLSELQESRTAWYVAFGKEKHGPLSQADIHSLLLEKRPEADILVWKSGFSAWKRLAETPEFAETLAALHPGAVVTPVEEPKVRPSFTELVQSETATPAETHEATAPKIDILDLMKKEAEAPAPAPEAKPAVKAAPAPAPAVAIKNYVPPKKKKFPWVQAAAIAVVVLAVLGTPVYLAYVRVIRLPFLEDLPGVGPYFKVVERDRYAELKKELGQLFKIEEDKVKLSIAAAEEEKAAIENARKEARREREERMQRAAEWRAKLASAGGGGGGGGGSVGGGHGAGGNMEFDFGGEDDGLDTEGELKTNDIDRKKILTQSEISEIINRNRQNLTACVANYRNLEKGNAKSGSMTVQFVVSRRGSVVRAHTMTKAFEGSYVADCIESRIMSIHFPRSGGSVTASYPFSIN